MATAVAPLILRGRLGAASLAGEVVIVTGAGGGIGLEAARGLRDIGATVIVAEIDAGLCAASAAELFTVLHTDVGDERSVRELVQAVIARFGRIDAVINNATYAPAGASVVESTIEDWDRSYAVNLRGPVLLAKHCLPAMVEHGHGVFVCVSSTGGPFLAPYETLKSAQLALANSLDLELAGTGVIAFTIGPGLVPTPTATAAIERIAPRLGMTVEQFWRTNAGAVVSVEAAGAGFAAALAMAGRYSGQEISSTQALVDAGIAVPQTPAAPAVGSADLEAIAAAGKQVHATLQEQAAGWRQRSFFERQWMMRDFKQRVGVPVERALEMLEAGAFDAATLRRLARFYAHLGELAAGYVKDPAERANQAAITARWAAEVDHLLEALPR
jgi:NAD(P)-dependent dehydrogenase (short-subunit alcohol dehydrogenase family)